MRAIILGVKDGRIRVAASHLNNNVAGLREYVEQFAVNTYDQYEELVVILISGDSPDDWGWYSIERKVTVRIGWGT